MTRVPRGGMAAASRKRDALRDSGTARATEPWAQRRAEAGTALAQHEQAGVRPCSSVVGPKVGSSI